MKVGHLKIDVNFSIFKSPHFSNNMVDLVIMKGSQHSSSVVFVF